LPACLCLVAAVAATGCGENTVDAPSASGDPGAIHVHGLGVDPADGSLFVATHTGLFRAAPSETRARRVGDRYQDTMGFAVVGPNRFLGSGHPDGRDQLPPFLGLIESRDAGRSWTALSLQGKVDFHALEASGEHVYGYGSDFDTREPRFLASADRGRNWRELEAPEPLMSVAISPSDERSLAAAGEQGVFRSDDGGRSWSAVAAPGGGRLVWTDTGVVLLDLLGRAWHAAALDGRWRQVGALEAAPAAFDTGAQGELLAALHDGTIMRSVDVGRTWIVRARP
jgi:hypothetical protein